MYEHMYKYLKGKLRNIEKCIWCILHIPLYERNKCTILALSKLVEWLTMYI
jgi:hypothetical protein